MVPSIQLQVENNILFNFYTIIAFVNFTFCHLFSLFFYRFISQNQFIGYKIVLKKQNACKILQISFRYSYIYFKLGFVFVFHYYTDLLMKIIFSGTRIICTKYFLCINGFINTVLSRKQHHFQFLYRTNCFCKFHFLPFIFFIPLWIYFTKTTFLTQE